MSKLFLLLLTFMAGLIFLILPNTIDPMDYFPFSDMKVHFATHVYFINERIIMIIMAYIIANEEKQYRSAVWIFFWLLVLDLIDYLMTYNGVWFHIGSIPVSMNIIKNSIFGLTILIEWAKRQNL